VLAHESWLGENERHHVLQLVAETECAPGLVVSASRPKPACQGLVEEPAVTSMLTDWSAFPPALRKGPVPVRPHLF